MKILHISIILVLFVGIFFGMQYAHAQNVTNYTIPPNAIRTSNGGWITPPQTTDQNGNNLTIHYEGSGINVTGKVFPPPVPNSYANPGPPPDPVFVVDNRNQIDNFLTNHEILIHYDANLGISGSSPLDLEIKLANTDGIIFDDKKHLFLNNTNPTAIVFWRFIPTLPGNYTLEKYNNGILTSTTFFTVSNSPETLAYPILVSPLKQANAQIPISDIECRDSYKLVVKAENNLPACVTLDTANVLVKRGWTHDNTIVSTSTTHMITMLNETNSKKLGTINQHTLPSSLKLSLSVYSTFTNSEEAMGIDVSLNNTGSIPLTLAKSDNWQRNDLSSGPCSNLPLGIAILKGYYTEQNVTEAKSLVIYLPVPCPMPALIKSYTFEPLSDKATQECDGLFSCPGLADMKTHLILTDFMEGGLHHSFDPGIYTIVGGDEWGDVAIQHFTKQYTIAYSNVTGH